MKTILPLTVLLGILLSGATLVRSQSSSAVRAASEPKPVVPEAPAKGEAAPVVTWRDGKPETVLAVPALGCRIYKVVPAR